MGKRRYRMDVQLVASLAFLTATPAHSISPTAPNTIPARQKAVGPVVDKSTCLPRTLAAKSADNAERSYLREVLAKAINGQHPSARTIEIQAALVFALDQTRSTPEASVAALETFPIKGLSKNQAAAITNLLASRKTMLCGQGTGAALGDLSLTAGPDVGGGGVTSDYINP